MYVNSSYNLESLDDTFIVDFYHNPLKLNDSKSIIETLVVTVSMWF